MDRYFVLTCAVVLLVQSSRAADWPEWRGVHRDGHVAASERIVEKLPENLPVAWKIPIGEGLASPVEAKGKVIYFDNHGGLETLHAVSVQDGRELWNAPVGPTFSDSQGPTGPRCTPMVHDDLVFAQTCRGEFQCRGLADGKLHWRTNFSDFGSVFIGERGSAAGGSRHGNTGSPVADKGSVYVMVGSTNGACAASFEERTGNLVWKSQNDQSAYAAPLLVDLLGKRQLVVFATDALLGLDPSNGALLWRVPLVTGLGRHAITPIIHDDMVVAGSFQLGLVGVRITRKGGEFTAEKAWVNKAAAMNFSSPVAAGDFIYGLGTDKQLECVEIKSGAVRWRQSGCISTAADHAHAEFLVMKDRILMLNDSGELILFGASPEGYSEYGRTQVCGFNWCYPAYAGGRLYFRDAKSLYALVLSGGAE
jgi:outer membrane protein assembly factor BamB